MDAAKTIVLNEQTIETPQAEVNRVFLIQKANALQVGSSSAKARRKKLRLLLSKLMEYRPKIKEALYKDYKKHETEVDLTEIFPIVKELKFAIRNLSSWMANEEVPTPIALLGAKSYIKYEPKGVCLIISPWNFPINLSLGPLVAAVAAGNCVILKPSEQTLHASAVIKELVEEVFDESEVCVIEGGLKTSQILLSKSFNHIFFTGSPSVGKIVMEKAAKNLASVTLELGGKSPTIVDESADIKMAAKRIAWSKFMNNGQICISPDHVYVHKNKKDEFLESVTEYIQQFYGQSIETNDNYARIVNNRHFSRLNSYLNEARENGSQIHTKGNTNTNEDFIPPTLMTNVTEKSSVMRNEIFGPILPVFEFSEVNEVIDKINSGEKPLALYIYSRDKAKIHHILNNTRAGGGCINHSLIHFFNSNLPFGGSNNSGIGKSKGRHGFLAFSNARGIMHQKQISAVNLFMPPFTPLKEKLINWAIKYL